MKVAVILPAAGKSVRFGLGDKLGQDLGGRPVLLRSVEAFAKRDDVAVVIVAAPADGVDEQAQVHLQVVAPRVAAVVAERHDERRRVRCGPGDLERVPRQQRAGRACGHRVHEGGGVHLLDDDGEVDGDTVDLAPVGGPATLGAHNPPPVLTIG